MAKNVINKYLWIIDTIQRYRRLTLEEFNDLWVKSSLSDGEPMSRRTFYNYRQGIADVFNIVIENDFSNYQYYIANNEYGHSSKMLNMFLDSVSMSGMLRDSHDVNSRIILEEIPSAQIHLPLIIQALKENNRVTFSYQTYNRINASKGVTIEPYCVRLFKQLWYVIGYNIKDRKIKTYSLDRMSEVTILQETFEMPESFDAPTYFNDCFGIMTSQGKPKNIVLRVSSQKAKYFRALPPHHSQREVMYDHYSLFHFRLHLTNDFVAEILSHGPDVQVVKPLVLRTIVINQLKNALNQY